MKTSNWTGIIFIYMAILMEILKNKQFINNPFDNNNTMKWF